MDTIDTQILKARSPLDIKDPGQDLIDAIKRGIAAMHDNRPCNDERCPSVEKLQGHVYLSVRAMKGLPHLPAVILARGLLQSIDSAPEEIAAAIKVAGDLNPFDLFPPTAIN